MRWDEIDIAGTIWRIPNTKNGTPQTIPLGKDELAILERRNLLATGPWVFPGRSSSGHMAEPQAPWERICRRAGIKDLRMHDVRRTLGSWMVDTGASLPIIGKTLNHLSPQSTAVYARLSMDPVREAKGRAIDAMLESLQVGRP
jgi:integrase